MQAVPQESLWAVVLAAGESRRLGRPKQLVRWHGDTLLGHCVRKAQALCGKRVIVVLGANHAAISSALTRPLPAVVLNDRWAEGLGGSLRTGIAALPEDCDGALLLTCDQPLVTLTALRSLAQEWKLHPDCAVASAYAETFGIPAVLPARTFDTLQGIAGDRGARDVLRAEGERLVLVPVPDAAVDVDDESAVEALERAGIAAGSRSHSE